MKNEDFDEAIRQKLEGLDQSYSEADVDKVFRHVTKPRGGLFHWLGSHWYVPVLSVAALVGISYLAVLMMNPNKPEDKRTEVVKPATEVQIPEQYATPDQSAEAKVRETKAGSGQTLAKTSVTSITSDKTTTKISSNKSPKKESSGTKKESTTSVSNFTEQKKAILAQGTEKAIRPKETVDQNPTVNEDSRTANNKANEVVTIAKAEDPVPVTNQNSESANAAKPGKTAVAEENNAVAEETSKLVTQSEPKQADNQSSKVNEPVNSGSGATQLNPVAEEKGTDTFKPSLDWSLKPQTGIRIAGNLPFSNQSFGGSFTGEKLFGQHFGLSLGVAYNSTFSEKFTDKKDLDKRSHHPVDPHMVDRLGGDEHPVNISIHNTIYQVPLRINYYQQLKPGVAFSVSAGTDFDFFVKQNINFDNPRDSVHGERHEFQNNGTVDPFNSLVISAGMEKQWKRLGLMIQPFIVPHLKQVFYKPKEFEYGFGIQLNYRLFQ